jgi:hypothetical protein
VAALTTGMALGLGARATATPDRGVVNAPAPTAKPYTLFLGAEVSVERQKQYYRVKDVDLGAFLIAVKGEPVRVPMDRGRVNLKVDPALKLTEQSANIADLKAERAYTPARDPIRKFVREQPGIAGMAAVGKAMEAYDFALRQQAAGQLGAAARTGFGNLPSTPGDSAVNQALQGIDRTLFTTNHSDMYNPGYFAGRAQEELAKQLFDAMDVRFTVSSERPLSHPYLLLITTFRPVDATPGAVQNWIYAQELPPVGPKPQKVHIQQGGFPEGFELKHCSVHLYNDGVEIATNVASKRVPLTRDEAFQYVVMEHLSSHKGANVAASLVLNQLPPDLRDRVVRGDYGGTYYVRVSRDGLGMGIFHDHACARPVDDGYLVNLVKDLRFRPALEKGKPVESIYPLSLAPLSGG